MKTLKTTWVFSLLFLLAVGLTSCSDDDNRIIVDLSNAVDVIAEDPELTSLATALEVAGLEDILRNAIDVTVLAPTNDAFADYLGSTPIEDVPVPVLRQLLLNHVLVDRLPSVTITAAESGYTNTNANGPNNALLSIYFEYDENSQGTGIVFNGQSMVEEGDIFATNGLIHKMDTVIDVPTIATFATTNPALSSLVAALQLADTGDNPTVDWIDTVSDPESGPLTVFAPTNDAFDDLLLELDPTGQTDLEDLDPAVVDAVLLMHVALGNVQSSQLPDLNGTIPTLGGDLDLDLDTLTITDPQGRTIAIVESLVDIQGVNGVVHVVDTVILPAE